MIDSGMRRLPASIAILLATLSPACNNGFDEGSTVGSFSATLAGALNEVFEAEGRYPESLANATTFAAGRIVPNLGFYIVGNREHEGLQDYVQLELASTFVPRPGVYSAEGGVHITVSSDPSVPRKSFRIVSGELRISHASDFRVRGAFTAIAVGLPPSPFDTVFVSRGTFDVPIVYPPQ